MFMMSVPAHTESSCAGNHAGSAPGPAVLLDVADLPHNDATKQCTSEEWSLHAHFNGEDGQPQSAFVSFTRYAKAPGVYGYGLQAALSDVKTQSYVHEALLDRDMPAQIQVQLNAGIVKDRLLAAAFGEVLNSGSVPLPDALFDARHPLTCESGCLSIDLQTAQLQKMPAGAYTLRWKAANGQSGLDLIFTPAVGPVHRSLGGSSRGHFGGTTQSYSLPSCAVSGTVTRRGVTTAISNGKGWYDHSATFVSSPAEAARLAWSSVSIQLSNGQQLALTTLVDPATGALLEKHAAVIDASGSVVHPDLTLTEGEEWTSLRTFQSSPTTWNVKSTDGALDLHLTAAFQDQEFITLTALPSFWKGRIDVTGRFFGTDITGVGLLERNGFQRLLDLGAFFHAVGIETRRAISLVYPDVMTEEDAVNLIATPATAWCIEGVDLEMFRKTLIAPVRYITDQGGKSWRSYGALACIDLVGGDSRGFARWLALFEFLHVGSLIVDDVEDKSEMRRGVPSCHHIFGEPTSINAGTAAYFQGIQKLLLPCDDATKLNRLYELYIGALRAGHAGQALDIAGLGYIMDDVIERRDGKLAEARITSIHRLKTAVPCATLSCMGAVVGGGSDAQVEAIRRYFDAIGVSFQIMDDVLNLRGVYTSHADKKAGVKLKVVGEDIMAGKVTFPVVKAITRLPKDEMKALWEVIKSKPQDPAIVAQVIQKLEDCGAITACEEHSRELVDAAYQVFSAVIPDSFGKIMLRAFGWYITDRRDV